MDFEDYRNECIIGAITQIIKNNGKNQESLNRLVKLWSNKVEEAILVIKIIGVLGTKKRNQ